MLKIPFFSSKPIENHGTICYNKMIKEKLKILHIVNKEGLIWQMHKNL